MSAWIVSRAHIDALVQVLCESETVVQDPNEVGRVLWAENLKSVAYLYSGDGDGDRPGPTDFRDADVTTYVYRRPSAKLTRHDQLVALDCWDYQSGDHPSFQDSDASRWVAALVERLKASGAEQEPETMQLINGFKYGIAWGLEDENVHAVVKAG